MLLFFLMFKDSEFLSSQYTEFIDSGKKLSSREKLQKSSKIENCITNWKIGKNKNSTFHSSPRRIKWHQNYRIWKLPWVIETKNMNQGFRFNNPKLFSNSIILSSFYSSRRVHDNHENQDFRFDNPKHFQISIAHSFLPLDFQVVP